MSRDTSVRARTPPENDRAGPSRRHRGSQGQHPVNSPISAVSWSSPLREGPVVASGPTPDEAAATRTIDGTAQLAWPDPSSSARGVAGGRGRGSSRWKLKKYDAALP